jgi:hypothetical protein
MYEIQGIFRPLSVSLGKLRFGAGLEILEVALFPPNWIPRNHIALPSVVWALDV